MARRLFLVGAGLLLAACGSDSDSGGSSSGGSGGSGASGGTGGSGASAGSPAGGSGGTSGSGGAPGGGASMGGAAGSSTGGTGAAGSTACPAPTGANETALCITFAHEIVTFDTDPRFDGNGVLSVELFAIPDPPSGPNAPALFSQLYPADAVAGGELAIASLPVARVTRQDMPSTVYVRAVFFDNADAFDTEGVTAGTWIGGLDLASGLREGVGLSPITVTQGAGNETTVTLVPVRELTVTVTSSATPVGDGEGPILLVVADSQDPEGGGPPLGSTFEPCVDVADMPVALTLPLIAPAGTYYVTGVLNDLGIQGDFPPGVLAAIEPQAGGGAIFPHELVLAPTDYRPGVTIDLSFTNPWPGDAGALPPNSCAEIAARAQGDGGAP